MRPINVLLLLSSKQLPPPIQEIDALVEDAKLNSARTTHFATTRSVGTHLKAGHSTVALYGDRELEFRLLAYGTFSEFIPLYEPRWAEIIDQHPTYSRADVPDTTVGLIEIEAFERAGTATLGGLRAYQEDGAQITTELIRGLHAVSEHDVFGTYASSIYFVSGGGPDADERLELLLAKKNELEAKTADFAARWRRSEDDRTKIQKDISAAAKKFAPILEGLGEPTLGVSIASVIGEQSEKGLLAMFRLAASIALSDGDADLFDWLLAEQHTVILTRPADLEREAKRRFSNKLPERIWRSTLALENAIWKAQAVVYLPSLDRIRRKYISRYDFWDVPWPPGNGQMEDENNRIQEREKLELGHLRDQAFRYCGKALGYEIAKFAKMRNDLCHLRMLSIDKLTVIEEFRL